MTKFDKTMLGAFLVLWFLLGELMYCHVVDGQIYTVVRTSLCGVLGVYSACRLVGIYSKKKTFSLRHFFIIALCVALIAAELCWTTFSL